MKAPGLFLAGFILASSVFAENTRSLSADSLPAFKSDSSKAAIIREIEAGKSFSSTANSGSNPDSLDAKVRRRRVFLGATLSFAFADFSARPLFAGYMDSVVAKDTLRVLQAQDPVAIYFPAGLMIGVPVFPYLDIWLRSEHFWYRESGLAQGNQTDPQTREFWYAVQGHLAGIGARYLVPVSLLSVNNHPGVYAAYTRYWNFGPTGIYASTGGSVRARTDPGGAGYEIQAGYQQDFDRRWTWTGSLAYMSLEFASNSSWREVLPGGPGGSARWTLRSLRFCLQGFYQFGGKEGAEKK